MRQQFEMKILAIIPARGGSKGVPRKNIKDFRGFPLILWTIKAAKSSKFIDEVVVSSDDTEIIDFAKQNSCNVPFVRSAGLSQDSTPAIDVVLDTINRCPGFDWLILLQPTSPLRDSNHIDECITDCLKEGRDSYTSVTPVIESPYWMFTLNEDKIIKPVIAGFLPKRRQDLKPVYRLNGAIYFAKIKWVQSNKTLISSSTGGYVMSNQTSLDIDTEEHFKS